MHLEPNFNPRHEVFRGKQSAKLMMLIPAIIHFKFVIQLFRIHGVKNGHYIPLVFCLISNKTHSSYAKFFQSIIQECANLELKFESLKVIVDFEGSIYKAIKLVWTSVEIVGCRFHLAQSWIRRIQQLGLINEYKDSSSQSGIFFHWIFRLTFLEPQNIGD